jgi:hypothetical protein
MAGRGGAHADSHDGGNSNVRDHRDRPNAAHISGASLLRPLEIIEPRVRLGGRFGRAGDDDDGAVGANFVAANLHARRAGLDAKLENRVLTDSELEAVSGGRNDPYRGFSFRIDVSGIQRGGF